MPSSGLGDKLRDLERSLSRAIINRQIPSDIVSKRAKLTKKGHKFNYLFQKT